MQTAPPSLRQPPTASGGSFDTTPATVPSRLFHAPMPWMQLGTVDSVSACFLPSTTEPTPIWATCSAAIRTAWRHPSAIVPPVANTAPSVASTVSPAPQTSRTWTGTAGTRRTARPSDHHRPSALAVTTTWHPCRIANRRAIMAGGSPTLHPSASAASIRLAVITVQPS
jgi:hypothetical protein